MSLFIIVISLILEFFVGRWQQLRRLDWMVSYRETLYEKTPVDWNTGWRGLLLLLLPIVLGMLLLQAIVDDHAFGLFKLLLGIAVLTYCLGPESFDELVNEYLHACEQKDVRQAQLIAKKILLEPPSNNIHHLSSQVTRAIFYEAEKRLFGVLFWFLLLGPVGALLYRIAVFLAEESYARNPGVSDPALMLHGVLDWAPSRLLALTFFMAGSFEDALRGWHKSFTSSADLNMRNRMFVILTGTAAMRHEVDDAVEHPDRREEYDLQWLRAARALVLRSLIVWVAMIALLTLFGSLR
jgi:membrane protein required for beta-lactamase induction